MTNTTVISVLGCKEEDITPLLRPAVEDLLAGYPVGMPTETVYGLAANALDSAACERIYRVKNRPADNPLIVHISSLYMLRLLVRRKSAAPVREKLTLKSLPCPSFSAEEVAVLDDLEIPECLKPVLLKFWPGPLTVLLPKTDNVPDIVTAGLHTVAVRFPQHPVARLLISSAGVPLAAPSANLSGRPSPTTAQHVLDDLNGRVNFIIDGGNSGFGLESTVLDATRKPPLVLRPGSITVNMLQELLPDVRVFRKGSDSLTAEEARQMEERPATPGMKYRHYSPTSPLLLFRSSPEADPHQIETTIRAFIAEELNADHRIARISPVPSSPPVHDDLYYEFPLAQRIQDQDQMARSLFAALRAADAVQPDLIVAQSVREEDEGLAIMNRLEKAASATRII